MWISAIFLIALVVKDTDGSAFITKAEFDSLKNNFQAQIDSYNSSIDSKIDGAIAGYLSGIKVSNQVTLNALSLGTLNYQGRGSSSDDKPTFEKNQALEVDYTWNYATTSHSSDYPRRCVSTSYNRINYIGVPRKFNGFIKSGEDYIYQGFKKFFVKKTQTANAYKEATYGASLSPEGATINNAYAGVLPCAFNTIQYGDFTAMKWSDFKSGLNFFDVPNSNLNWNNLRVGVTKNCSFWSSASRGSLRGSAISTTNWNYHLETHTYNVEDAPDDYFINVYNSSDHTFLYSLNTWDGIGFGGFEEIDGVTSWGFDGSIILNTYNTLPSTQVYDESYGHSVLDLNNADFEMRSDGYECAKYCALASIFEVNFGELYYPNSVSVYNGGQLVDTRFHLNDNIPLVNVLADGTLNLPLEFKANGNYRVWLDTVKSNAFTSKRSTALCPEGKSLATDGSFTVTISASSPTVNLKVPVKKNTTVFIKWKNANDDGNSDIVFNSEYKEDTV